jgi:hypothetical protein
MLVKQTQHSHFPSIVAFVLCSYLDMFVVQGMSSRLGVLAPCNQKGTRRSSSGINSRRTGRSGVFGPCESYVEPGLLYTPIQLWGIEKIHQMGHLNTTRFAIWKNQRWREYSSISWNQSGWINVDDTEVTSVLFAHCLFQIATKYQCSIDKNMANVTGKFLWSSTRIHS